MKKKLLLVFFATSIAAAGLAGCTSSQRVKSARPGTGTFKILNKPKNIVFPAAVRVMLDRGEELWEAKESSGRIVALGIFGTRAVFLTPLSHGRTRVELSGLFIGSENFFTLLREQIAVFEKKEANKKFQVRKKEIDADLRKVYRPDSESDKKKAEPEPEPAAPAPPSRINRFRRR